MMYDCASWPGKLAFGVSLSEVDMDKCIADLHRDFKICVKAQDVAVKRRSAFNIFVVKEIVYVLFGPHDKPADWVKERFHRVVHRIFKGWGQTKIVEYNVKEIRELK